MYNSQEVAMQIKTMAKDRNIPLGKLLDNCGLSKNALSTMQSRGYLPRVENLVKIADGLECSLDYLLGRDGENKITMSNIGNNNNIIGHNGTIKHFVENTAQTKLETDMLNIFRNADGKTQMKIMQFMYDLEKKERND